MNRMLTSALTVAGCLVAPIAPAVADDSTGVNSPSGKISCRVFDSSITCYGPFASGKPGLLYQLGGAVTWMPDAQPADGRTLSYGSPVAVRGWQIDAETDGLTFKKNGKGVFVSVQDAHAL